MTDHSMAGGPVSSFWGAVRGHPIRTFAICFVGMIMSTMDQALFSYAIPGISREFGASLNVMGQILSLSFFVASLSVLVSGVLTDYLGRKRMFVAMMALSATFVGCHAFANSLTMLATFRVIGFALAVGLYPITATIVIEVAPARYRGMLSGWLQLTYPLGFALGAIVASGFLSDFGWRVIFYPAFVVVPLAFILGKLLNETKRFEKAQGAELGAAEAAQSPDRRRLGQHIGELLSPRFRRRSVVCLLGTFCSNIAIGGMTYFLPSFLAEDRGMSEGDAAGLLVWSWGIAAVGYVLASYVGEFILTRRNTVILWQWLGALCLALTLWFANSDTMLMIGLGVSTMFFFGSECVRMPLTGEIFPTRIRATASAATGALAVTLASLTAPLIITSAVPILGWTWTFTFFGVVPLLLAGLIFTQLENFPSGVEVEELSR